MSLLFETFSNDLTIWDLILIRTLLEDYSFDFCFSGSYSFIDPSHKVRTVQYTADETGFHASLINYEDTIAQPVDSEAVRLAKEKHYRLYQKIAQANAQGASANLPRVINSRLFFYSS